jgi:hypothetical protein
MFSALSEMDRPSQGGVSMPEMILECPQCRQPFSVSEEEQARCAENGFAPPTYCPDCYRQRKAAKDEVRDRQRRGSKRRR